MINRTLHAALFAAVATSACGKKSETPPNVETAPAAAIAQVDGARIEKADSEPGNWLSTGRTYGDQRYSPLDRINAGNVAKLSLAWTYKVDVDRGAEATPLVVDGTMYTTGAYSIVYALDAKTGALKWRFDPEVSRAGKSANACCDVVNRGVALHKGRVYLGAFDGRLIALDARDGKKVWEVDTVETPGSSQSITGAPLIVKNLVLIGNAGAEFRTRGYLSAYDADSGKLVWRFHTVPGDPAQPPENKAMEMAAKTRAGKEFVAYGGGGTVWNSIAHDPELGLIYFGTANGQSWNKAARKDPKGDNLFVASIVALKVDSGEYAWHYQETPGDMWDYDSTANPVLADLTIGGKLRKVLMHAPKNSFFYVIDRATGELISAEKFAPANWATHVDLKTGRPAVDMAAADWSAGPKLLIPGPVGSHNWQPMSYSPKTGLVYIPAQEAPGVLAPVPDPKPKAEGLWSAGADFRVPEDPKTWKDAAEAYKGRLLAWDPVAQKKVWSQEHEDVWNGGTLATGGNLVFQGTADGRFVAYSADQGAKLWEVATNSGVMAGPMTYLIDGEQYVSVMAGWGGAYPLLIGPVAAHTRVMPEARVLTYKIAGSASLPPPKNLPAPPPEPPALTADAKRVDQGRFLYAENCSQCHGMGAISGRIVPDLRYLSAQKHAEFAAIVAGARANNGMPSFVGKLASEEVEAVHQYLIQRALDLKQELAAVPAGK